MRLLTIASVSALDSFGHRHYGNHFDAYGHDFRHNYTHALSALDQEKSQKFSEMVEDSSNLIFDFVESMRNM